MNSMNDQGLLQEIEEDLARQRMEAFWKRYGSMLVIGALLIVIGTAAITGWKTYSFREHQKTTQAYLALMDKKNDIAASKADLAATFEDYASTNAGTALSVLARLQAASIALQDGKKDAALKIYNEVAADQKTDLVFRQFADLLYVMTEMDTGDVKTLEARLEPLMKEGAWRFSAKEFAGHLALRGGDAAKAKALFLELKMMTGVPKSTEQRAADMAQWLSKGE